MTRSNSSRTRHVLEAVLIFAALLWPHELFAQEESLLDGTLDSLLNIPVTTAAKYSQRINQAASSVTIITGEDIRRFGYRTLAEVLAGVRSMYVSYDRNYTYLGVRGFSRPTDYNDRILLMYDGIALNENVYGMAAIGNEGGIDLNTIDRIEIVRGPGSPLYGQYAMFAVVNVIPRQGSKVNGFRPSFEIGSFGYKRANILYGDEIADGFDVLLSGTWGDVKGKDRYYMEFDSDSTNNGIAQGLDWEKFYGMTLVARYQNISGFLKFNKREKPYPTAAYSSQFNDSRAHTHDDYLTFGMNYERSLSTDISLYIRGYYNHYLYEGAYPGEVLVRDASTGKWFGAETRLLWDVFANNRVIVGAEVQRVPRADYEWWYESDYGSDNHPYTLYSGFIQNEWQFHPSFLALVSLRYDRYSTGQDAISPRLGLVYHPGEFTAIKALSGTAFRPPNAYESITEKSVHEDKLDQETIWTNELIVEHRFSQNLYSTLSLFDYRMNDLIDQELDDQDVIHYHNAGKVRAQGIELEVHFHPLSNLTMNASYSYQRAVEDATNAALSNHPSHLAKLNLSYKVAEYGSVSASAYYETSRLTVYETRTEPYFLMNLHLHTEPMLNILRFSFLVRNLLNTTYATPGGLEHVQHAITQDERNFVLGIQLAF